jgi:hypothetical protein
MIACNTDVTVVIVSSIFMVMRNGHRGKKEVQYEKKSKAFVAAHGSSLKHRHRLPFADLIVNMLFKFS